VCVETYDIMKGSFDRMEGFLIEYRALVTEYRALLCNTTSVCASFVGTAPKRRNESVLPSTWAVLECCEILSFL